MREKQASEIRLFQSQLDSITTTSDSLKKEKRESEAKEAQLTAELEQQQKEIGTCSQVLEQSFTEKHMQLTREISEKKEQYSKLKEQYSSECDARAKELQKLHEQIEATSAILKEWEDKTTELKESSAHVEVEL